MKSNQLAIIVAFYLSKFDKVAKKRLGFRTDAEAFREISRILEVEKNYVKFRRDEFDPIHPWRKGWQRPMDKRIIRAIEALQDLSEKDLGDIVKKILKDENYRNSDEIESITRLLSDEIKSNKSERRREYILRGPTGKKAEEYFIEYFKDGNLSIEGNLEDTRDLGCGYDFKIIGKTEYFFEIKGLAEIEGGILFTSKEWITAKKYDRRYFLVIVRNLNSIPEIEFYQDPASKLSPKKNIVTTIQVQWSITTKELNND